MAQPAQRGGTAGAAGGTAGTAGGTAGTAGGTAGAEGRHSRHRGAAQPAQRGGTAGATGGRTAGAAGGTQRAQWAIKANTPDDDDDDDDDIEVLSGEGGRSSKSVKVGCSPSALDYRPNATLLFFQLPTEGVAASPDQGVASAGSLRRGPFEYHTG